MTHPADEKEFSERMSQLQNLLQEVEEIPEPGMRERTSRIIQSLLEFHGAGISRILEHLAEAGQVGHQTIDALAKDDLVSSLLLLYGLHPLGLDARVKLALEKKQARETRSRELLAKKGAAEEDDEEEEDEDEAPKPVVIVDSPAFNTTGVAAGAAAGANSTQANAQRPPL